MTPDRSAPKDVGRIRCPCLGAKTGSVASATGMITFERYSCGAECTVSLLPGGDVRYRWRCENCRVSG